VAERRLGLVPNRPARETINVGEKAYRVKQLDGIVFRYGPRAWTFERLERHDNVIRPAPDPKTLDEFSIPVERVVGRVGLYVRHFPLRGVGDLRTPVRVFELFCPSNVYDIGELGELPVPYRSWAAANWERIDPADHYPVCPDCETLFPCLHFSEINRRRRDVRWARMFDYCEKCGRDVRSGMKIEFPEHRTETVHVSTVPLRAVTPADGPTDFPENPTIVKSVWFHGKRGPCENAAYRYASAHGWELPAKDQPRERRRWHIRAVRPAPTVITDTEGKISQ